VLRSWENGCEAANGASPRLTWRLGAAPQQHASEQTTSPSSVAWHEAIPNQGNVKPGTSAADEMYEARMHAEHQAVRKEFELDTDEALADRDEGGGED
jgi:hypothetical protein